MKKKEFNCVKYINDLVLTPFFAVTRVSGTDFLLFDSRFLHDSTRSLRVSKLSNLSEGNIVVRQGEMHDGAHRFYVEYCPYASGAAIELLGVVTVDFARLPLSTAAVAGKNNGLTVEECEQLAFLFAAKLRGLVLTAAAEALQTVPLYAESSVDMASAVNVPIQPAIFQTSAPTVERLRLMKPAVDNKMSGKHPVLKWMGRAAIAAVVLLGLLIVLARLMPQQKDGSEAIASTAGAGGSPEIYERIAAAARAGAGNPTGIPNVTEQTLKSMGLDPGKAAANLGCLAQ